MIEGFAINKKWHGYLLDWWCIIEGRNNKVSKATLYKNHNWNDIKFKTIFYERERERQREWDRQRVRQTERERENETEREREGDRDIDR